VRLVSWNLAGAPHTYRINRYGTAVKYLRETLQPDVALLQEARFDQELTANFPGYSVLECARPGDQWGSVILVKDHRASAVQPAPGSSLDALTSYLAYADVQVPGLSPLRVVSVHAPPTRAATELAAGADMATPTRGCGVWHSDVILSALADDLRQRGGAFIVGGDWNESPYLWDEVYGVRDGAEFFAAVAAAGWTDCVRQIHREQDDLRTYFSPRSRHYQIDHVFTDESTAALVEDAWVDSRPAADGLSDHAPLIISLAIAG
jgi:exonuclease III